MRPSEPPDDLLAALTRIGFRAPHDVLAAFFAHAHKSRLSPTQVAEQLVALERRAREATNLERRKRLAYLGTFKSIDRFDWAHPRKIDRALLEKYSDNGEVVVYGRDEAGNTGHILIAPFHGVPGEGAWATRISGANIRVADSSRRRMTGHSEG